MSKVNNQLRAGTIAGIQIQEFEGKIPKRHALVSNRANQKIQVTDRVKALREISYHN
jgi:hypothetical protein